MAETSSDPFEVSYFRALGSGLVHRHPSWWIRAGDLESSYLASRLGKQTVSKPVFIVGLARAGTTILLTLLASVPGVATHRYRDFPGVFTPWWWNWFVDHAGKKEPEPRERAHRDRILVTRESPEAMEEPLWMAFFSHTHEPAHNNVIDAICRNPAFEKFYLEHIKKILLIRNGSRYVAKGNYNISRMGYLKRLFPDARFVVVIREPHTHVASLMRQQRIFFEATHNRPRALAHLRYSGHFEFGPGRHPINVGDAGRADEVTALWQQGEEARGWSRYWSQIYTYVDGCLKSDPELSRAALLVRYEDLCADPIGVVDTIVSHCELAADPTAIEALAQTIKAPDYYTSDIPRAVIRDETQQTARRFGY